jgi:hypothetical protein
MTDILESRMSSQGATIENQPVIEYGGAGVIAGFSLEIYQDGKVEASQGCMDYSRKRLKPEEVDSLARKLYDALGKALNGGVTRSGNMDVIDFYTVRYNNDERKFHADCTDKVPEELTSVREVLENIWSGKH